MPTLPLLKQCSTPTLPLLNRTDENSNRDLFSLFKLQLYLEATSNFTWNGAVLVRTLNTLGLGLICQYKSLDGLQAGLTQLLLPPFMILVIVVLWVLARRGIGARLWKFFQRRNSMMQVFWLVILFSASNTAYRSAHLLRWAMIGPHRVVYLESTIGYLSLAHLPYALFALVMLIFAVLPAPILLLWRPLHIWPALKVFIDEATHIYEDDRQWWAAISILRRMLFGLLHALLPSGPRRRASNAMLFSVILAAQGIFRYDNPDQFRLSHTLVECRISFYYIEDSHSKIILWQTSATNPLKLS